MTIPEKPLVFLTNADDLSNGDFKRILRMGEPDDPTAYPWFLDFLAKHTNWTIEEIDEITLGEMREIVSPQLAEALKAKTVPLPS